MKRILALTVSHLVVLALGFALGIYLLPILTAPPGPTAQEVRAFSAAPQFTTQFKRGLKGSDALHWGEGAVTLGAAGVALMGRIAPGPAYKLYLVPEFVETEADFKRVKAQSLAIGDIKTFENFIVPLPAGVDLNRYNTVVIWCESFSQFITAGQYR
ncbi:DM13 domain-containing protein [Caenimonas sp. SL110]|uniref:DM13 domain-containing protein n=1 Tax=Caenimonas sp. SL110 TaxID=1450524 RepID=UPI0006542934|nr:DM13 domain-containing protein [Caenimonas sp. SL110]